MPENTPPTHAFDIAWQNLLARVEHTPPTAFDIAWQNLEARIERDLRPSARIPEERRIDIGTVFSNWIYEINSVEESQHSEKLLNEIRRGAIHMRRLLEKLQSEISKTGEQDTIPVWVGIMRGNLMYDGAPGDVAHEAEMMSRLVTAIEDVVGGKTRGRSKGNKRYPGLRKLVYDLEYAVLSAGGRTFGLPTTQPPKGRIIYMLDGLSAELKNAPELNSFAGYLPPRNCHPVPMYQQAIQEARREYSEYKRLCGCRGGRSSFREAREFADMWETGLFGPFG